MSEHGGILRVTAAVMLLVMAGCVEIPPLPTEGGSESSSAGPASSTGTTPDTTSDLGSSEEADTAASTEPMGMTTAPAGDVGGVGDECDQLAQDCPPGLKCAPWYGDGGWNPGRCVPVADDPAQLGEPCHTERWPSSGLDDCAVGSMCWYIDPVTLEGTCTGHCIGSEMDGVFDVHCEDPQALCMITSAPTYLCLPVCDPLVQDCPADQACYPSYGGWQCASDESGAGGAYGAPC